MALIDSKAASHDTISKAFGNPPYINEPTTCPIISITQIIIQLRKELLILKRLILHLLLSLAAAGRIPTVTRSHRDCVRIWSQIAKRILYSQNNGINIILAHSWSI